MNNLGDGEGFLLLSTGEKRKQWLFNLVASIRETYPRAPIHVLTDAPVDVQHTIIDSAEGYDSRHYKTRLFYYSPFNTTIFLDDDTIVKSSFGTLEDLLKNGDIGMALDPFATLGLWRDNVVRNCMGNNAAWDAFADYVHPGIESCPYFNSGVMVWRRKNLVGCLFDHWHNLWLGGGKGPDQTWLARALLELNIEVVNLPLELNFYPVTEHCIGHSFYPSIGNAKIIHFLSRFGKEKMGEFVTAQAPEHNSYSDYKKQIMDSGAL